MKVVARVLDTTVNQITRRDPIAESRIESLVPVVEKLRRGPWLQVLSPRGFEWNRITLPVPRLPRPFHGLRALHLTDVHLRPRWWRAHDELLDRIRSDPPDLILHSGDLLEHKFNPRPSLPVLERFLHGLQSRLGTFAIIGNHDGDLLAPQISRCGVTVLNDSSVLLRDRDDESATLELIGLLGVNRLDYFGADLPGILPPPAEGSLRIILSHYPDSIRHLARLKPDIVLSGHTHGGQICLPGGVPIIKHDSLPRRMCRGVHRVGDTWLVVGRGFGFAKFPVRLFCPGEVIELRLVPPA